MICPSVCHKNGTRCITGYNEAFTGSVAMVNNVRTYTHTQKIIIRGEITSLTNRLTAANSQFPLCMYSSNEELYERTNSKPLSEIA